MAHLHGGGSQTDALLAGNVDIVNTGTGNLLLLWDRTRGGVKGIVATSALPLLLVSRDPKIRTIKDIGPGDKVAVPTVKVSTQAILLQMAAGEIWGADQSGRLDASTVQLGHPDAAIALANPTTRSGPISRRRRSSTSNCATCRAPTSSPARPTSSAGR